MSPLTCPCRLFLLYGREGIEESQWRRWLCCLSNAVSAYGPQNSTHPPAGFYSGVHEGSTVSWYDVLKLAYLCSTSEYSSCYGASWHTKLVSAGSWSSAFFLLFNLPCLIEESRRASRALASKNIFQNTPEPFFPLNSGNFSSNVLFQALPRM